MHQQTQQLRFERRSHIAFWANSQHVEELFDAVAAIMAEFDLTPDRLVSGIAQCGYDAKNLPSPQFLRRFEQAQVTGEIRRRVNRPEKLTNLLYGLRDFRDTTVGESAIRRVRPGANPEQHLQVLERTRELLDKRVIDDLIARLERTVRGGARAFESQPTPDPLALALVRFANTDDADLRTAHKYFADGAGGQPAYFLVYRFSLIPGEVVKSFLVIKPTSDESAACAFSWFNPEIAGERRTNGVVVPMREALYLVGEADKGSALEVLALQRLGTPKNAYRGLALSFDADREIVSGRFVMVRTNIDHSNRAGVGFFKLDDLRDELSPYLDEIRNRVDSRHERRIRWDGAEIAHSRVVEIVGKALEDETGTCRMTDELGAAFNPADHSSLPFNSVLRMPRRGR